MSEKNYQLYAFGYGQGRRWDLLEAIELINGDDDENFYFIASDNFEDEGKNKARLELNRNKLSYKRAIKDIEAHKLQIVNYDSFCALDKDFECLVEPRIFIEWCIKNSINVVPKLMKYFNYQYWLQKDFWSFDQAISVLLSNNSPFPNDIKNVFETDEKSSKFATSLLNAMRKNNSYVEEFNSIHYGALGFYLYDSKQRKFSRKNIFDEKSVGIRDYYFDKHELFLFLEEQKIKIVKNLATEHLKKDCFEIKKKEEREGESNHEKVESFRVLELAGEESYDKRFDNYVPAPSDFVSLRKAFNTISKICPHYPNEEEGQWLTQYFVFLPECSWLKDRYLARSVYRKQFYLDYQNGKIEFLIDSNRVKLNSSKDELFEELELFIDVRIADFIGWANSNELEIPSILEEPIRQIGSLETNTPRSVAEDEIALEIEYKKLNDVDANLILKYPDKEVVLKKFKHNRQIGKIMVALIDKAKSNGGYIRLDDSLKNLNINDASFEPSKVPYSLGFRAQLEGASCTLRKVFFDDVCTKKCIEFYSRITKKRLFEIR